MNKNLRKKISNLLLGVSTFTLLATPVSAQEMSEVTLTESQVQEQSISPKLGFWNVYKGSGVVNSIQTEFTASQKTNTTSYGLTKGKHVKQSYVRLQEGKYDSGRKYSSTAKSTSDKTYYSTPKLSRVNNPLADCKTSWGWLYF